MMVKPAVAAMMSGSDVIGAASSVGNDITQAGVREGSVYSDPGTMLLYPA